MGWGRNASIMHTSLSLQDTDILKSNTKNTWFVLNKFNVSNCSTIFFYFSVRSIRVIKSKII